MLDDTATRNGATLPAQTVTTPVTPAAPAAGDAGPGSTGGVWPAPSAQTRPLWRRWGRRPGTAPDPQEIPEDEARRHARGFFWAWLLFAMTVSVGGNVIHHWMTAPADDLRLRAAIMAAVPPILLLGATHSVALLIKNRRRRYRLVDAVVLGVNLVITIGVAGCAFTMSFFSLRDLAIELGQKPDVAPLFSIAVDLSLICTTLGLLSLTSAQNEAGARAGSAFVGLSQPAAAVGAHVGEVMPAGVINTGPTSPAERRVWWESIAAVVRGQNGSVRKIADMTNGELAEVLERLFDNRESGRVISDSTPLHHREIKAIKDTAEGVLARTAAPMIS
jgi:hypothetical protein